MASAAREAIRAFAWMEPKKACDQHLEASGRIVSLAFRRLHRAKVTQDPADWLAGFEAGLRGDCYVYPAEVRDRLAWASGFVEGRAQQTGPQQEGYNVDCLRWASIRITPRFPRPFWELSGRRR
jgi:hypothetical protein